MDNNKPRVFPTQEQINAANQTGEEIARKQEDAIMNNQVLPGEAAAAEEMARRTSEQLRLREEALRQAELDRQSEILNQQVQPSMVNSPLQEMRQVEPTRLDNMINEISQPQMNQPYDIIPLPSEGKLYRNKKSRVKLSYLTAADENILTSPNLLESGDFLEILINRKLLEPDLRYKDLLPGDRDAIMIWLRSTGYGEIYPVTVLDENNQPFETEIDLSTLKFKQLTVQPDSEGLFTFSLPVSKSVVKFKLLTIGDIDELEKLAQYLKEENNLINIENTLLLENQIVEIDGFRDKNYISEFVDNMRILDSKKLKAYIDSITCGVEMNVTFRTPGGGSVTRFLPFTLKFFWPDFEL